MKGQNSISRALGTWAVLLGCALSAFPEPLRLVEQQIQIPERGSVTGYLVSVETNHFSFLPPPGWRTSHKPGGNSIAILSTDLTTSITIQLTPLAPNEPRPRRMELLVHQFPDEIIGKSVRCHTGLGPSRSYDIDRKPVDGVRITSRIIHAFTPTFAVQFTLTAPAAKFDEHTTTFANLVNSFHPAGQ